MSLTFLHLLYRFNSIIVKGRESLGLESHFSWCSRESSHSRVGSLPFYNLIRLSNNISVSASEREERTNCCNISPMFKSFFASISLLPLHTESTVCEYRGHFYLLLIVQCLLRKWRLRIFSSHFQNSAKDNLSPWSCRVNFTKSLFIMWISRDDKHDPHVAHCALLTPDKVYLHYPECLVIATLQASSLFSTPSKLAAYSGWICIRMCWNCFGCFYNKSPQLSLCAGYVWRGDDLFVNCKQSRGIIIYGEL